MESRKGEHVGSIAHPFLFAFGFGMSSVTYASRDVGDGVDGAGASFRYRCGDAPSGYRCEAPSGYYSRAGPGGDCHSVRPSPTRL